MLSGYTTQAKAVIEYCQRVGKVYSDVDYVTADDAALATKVMRKI